jgi:predicted  nucleic acid-binding Zn-ribbon protein
MLEASVAHPQLALVSVILAVALALALLTAVALFEQQRSRLPAATQLADIRQRRDLGLAELNRLRDQHSEMNKKIDAKASLAAEVAALEARRDALRLELSGLEDGRRQIEETKQAAANAATELAQRRDELTAAREALDEVEKIREARRAELTQVESKLKDLEKRVAEQEETLRNGLQAQVDEMRAELQRLSDSRTELRDEIEELRGERAQLLSARLEAAALGTQKEMLAREVKRLSDESTSLREEVASSVKQKAVADAELTSVRQETAETHRRVITLQQEIQALEARKAHLEAHIEGLKGWDRNHNGAGELEQMITDLKQLPALLDSYTGQERAIQQEGEALNEVHEYLNKLKLSYSRRTVLAFHTALKINDYSQLTVLAGVSGTGKSLLPRRYAEAMCMHFLPIAVEPRWDSPQDLLGFYNYVEKRYRATDLARALVQMDRFNTSGLSTGKFADHMMLVLLDEMNLARVEYYFSEFLSRLEARPALKIVADEKRRQDAHLTVDIRGVSEQRIQLFPSHNLLFAGTMNDDESTQSLSDKVLDRGNIMQFSAPHEFPPELEPRDVPLPSGYRSFKEWGRWLRTADDLKDEERERVRHGVEELAGIMENCGRPFGHRLNAAIFAYCANYPTQSRLGEALSWAMVDQVEFRILPKLRGLQIDDHTADFENLGKLISREFGDEKFAERLRDTVDKQRATGGLFNWRGYTRQDGE